MNANEIKAAAERWTNSNGFCGCDIDDCADDLIALAEYAVDRIAAEEAERAAIAAIHDKLKKLVCTEGPDAGVILLSSDSPTHTERRPNGSFYSVYDHEFFSPLGDALMSIHFDLLRALGINPEGGQS